MSRQRDYQKRMRASGRCRQCGDPGKQTERGVSPHCPACYEKQKIRNREYMREYSKTKEYREYQKRYQAEYRAKRKAVQQ